jgi:F0F1-type ATP synthase assembly protein I
MNQKNQSSDSGRYTSIAIQMLAIILAGVLGGYFLDKFLELKFHVFLVILSFLSVILAIYFVVKDLIKKK